MESLWTAFTNYLTNTVLPVVTSAGIKLILAVIFLVVGWKLINLVSKKVGQSRAFRKMDVGASTFLNSLISIALKVILVITIAAYLGVPMTSMVTALGSAGLAIGLALQGSLANLAGGLMILIFKQFKVGDYVVLASGEEGTVTDISILYTTLLTVDNRRVTIPNGTLANGSVTNNSAMSTRRVDLVFSASYDNDVELVKSTLLRVADECELIEKDPAPAAFLSNYNTSSMDYTLRVWTTQANYWSAQSWLREAMYAAFAAENISIPYAQVDIHVNKID